MPVRRFAVVALVGLIVGVPSLFDANGLVVFLVLVTAVLVTGAGSWSLHAPGRGDESSRPPHASAASS
ncbi:hypothetical protein SAMN04488548_136570 [Gordonia westfalica]|uniref:Uncharacterized protein n=1 Tax=Gordonia westfalica TaxID=158898 RepID=A0A1H2LLC0_9ACTN|nr:hypothetical protein SAMN04488548_136570 [Gordonia westfalica]